MKRKKGGFSLVEVIVAMVIVVLITGIGYLSCILSLRIQGNASNEAKAHEDAEKIIVSVGAAFDAVDRDSGRKEEFFKKFMEEMGWNFEAESFYDTVVTGHSLEGDAWSAKVPIIKNAEGISTRSVVVNYLGKDDAGNPTYSFEITVYETAYTLTCALNCRTEEYGGTITAFRNNEKNNNFMERTFNYGN